MSQHHTSSGPDLHAPGAARVGSSNASDWETYRRGRPTYPESLEYLIIDYHRKHSNNFRLAHDIGAGSGIYSSTLAKYFQHVHVSDVNGSAIEAAKASLGTWQRENQWEGTFKFTAAAAEQAHTCVADGSVDLAMLMEAAHWTDADAMVRSVARNLAPMGTLAMAYYNPVCTVLNNEKVNDAVQRLFDAWGHRPLEVGRQATRRGQRQINLGLDFVPLPHDLFPPELTQRININTHGLGSKAFEVPGCVELLNAPDAPLDINKVDPREMRLEYTSQDREGSGWVQVVNGDFFRKEISTMVHTEEMLERFEPLFREIERLIEETTEDGSVRTEWTVAILLATKKIE